MEKKKVYCQYCRYCHSIDGPIGVYRYECHNPHHGIKIDTAYEQYYDYKNISTCNRNNDCQYFKESCWGKFVSLINFFLRKQ